MESKRLNKQTKRKQTHGNRDLKDNYHKGGGGRKSEKGKRNIIKNINLHGDRLLLELVG